MNEQPIDQYISDLLFHYDCVIVPDFGGFVTNYAPARIHPAQHIFSPPFKRISFNKNLRDNDGLLANYIANELSISFIESRKLIDKFVNRCVADLGKGETIKLEKIGSLYLDEEKSLKFSPNHSVNYLLSSYGLSEFKVFPIPRLEPKQEIEKKLKVLVSTQPNQDQVKYRYPYFRAAAASFLVFLGIGYAAYKYQLNNDTTISYAALGLEYNRPEYAPHSVKNKMIFPESKEVNRFDKNHFELYNSKGELRDFVVKGESEAHKLHATEGAYSVLKFHVVGGCFANKRNAERLVKRLNRKGYPSKMIGTYKNLYVVSYNSFATENDAFALLDEVKNSENPKAWLLKK